MSFSASPLGRLAARAEAVSRAIAFVLTTAAALCVAGIVVVLVFASLQRYLLATPIPATEEIAAYLFVAMSFTAMVGGFVEGRHIRLLPVWRKLPPRTQNWALLAGHVGAVAILVPLIGATWDFAASSFRFGARSMVADLLEWPWMMLIPGSLALLALAILARMVADLDRAMHGGDAPEARRDVEEGL